MGGNASFAHVAQMIVPCVSSASSSFVQRSASMRLSSSLFEASRDMDVSGILDRSLTQAQHISQFLEFMIQLLNRGSAAVRFSVIYMQYLVTITRSKPL